MENLQNAIANANFLERKNALLTKLTYDINKSKSDIRALELASKAEELDALNKTTLDLLNAKLITAENLLQQPIDTVSELDYVEWLFNNGKYRNSTEMSKYIKDKETKIESIRQTEVANSYINSGEFKEDCFWYEFPFWLWAVEWFISLGVAFYIWGLTSPFNTPNTDWVFLFFWLNLIIGCPFGTVFTLLYRASFENYKQKVLGEHYIEYKSNAGVWKAAAAVGGYFHYRTFKNTISNIFK